MRRFPAVLFAWLALAGCATGASAPLSGLANDPSPYGSDIIPDLPSAGSTLENITLSQVQNFALTSLNSFTGVDPTGATDSTLGIQTAINTGQKLYCNGVYKTSATLTFNTAVNEGQLLVGAGAAVSNTATAGRCVFQPTSAVTKAFSVDGTAAGIYVLGVGIENITLDMTNMAVGSQGFYQGQGFDDFYENVRTINDTQKTGFYFGPGAYTTELRNIQASGVQCIGTGANDPTTITLVNPDIKQLNASWCANLTTIGGAIQPVYYTGMSVVYLPPGTNLIGYPANTAGLCAILGSYTANVQYFTTIGTDWENGGGFPSTLTCNSASPSTSYAALPVLEIGGSTQNANLMNPTMAGMYVYNLAGSGANLTMTGYQTGGGMGNYHEGAETFDTSMFLNNGAVLFGYSDNRTTQTLEIDAANGNFASTALLLRPTAAGDQDFCLYNTSAQCVIDMGQNGLGYVWLSNSSTFSMGSGIESGQTVSINGASGLVQLSTPGAAASITLTPSNGAIYASGGLYNTPVGASVPSTGAFTTLSASSMQLNARTLFSGTGPTYASGFSTGTPTISGQTTGAFTVTLGATPGATGVLTMPAVASGGVGYACTGIDRTTAAGTIRETATSTSSVTFALAGTAASDVLQFQCTGY